MDFCRDSFSFLSYQTVSEKELHKLSNCLYLCLIFRFSFFSDRLSGYDSPSSSKYGRQLHILHSSSDCLFLVIPTKYNTFWMETGVGQSNTLCCFVRSAKTKSSLIMCHERLHDVAGECISWDPTSSQHSVIIKT